MRQGINLVEFVFRSFDVDLLLVSPDITILFLVLVNIAFRLRYILLLQVARNHRSCVIHERAPFILSIELRSPQKLLLNF